MSQRIFAGLLLFLLAAGDVFAQDKVVIVDMGRVLEVYPAAREAEKKLGQLRTEFEEEAAKMVEELKGMKEAYTVAREAARNKALSEAARRDKVTEAEKLLTRFKEREFELREVQLEAQQNLEQDLIKARKEVIEQLKFDIAAYSKQKGYDLVLDSSGKSLRTTDQVIYASPKLDITDELLALFADGR